MGDKREMSSSSEESREKKRGGQKLAERMRAEKNIAMNDPLSMSVSMYAILAFTSPFALDLLWFDHT